MGIHLRRSSAAAGGTESAAYGCEACLKHAKVFPSLHERASYLRTAPVPPDTPVDAHSNEHHREQEQDSQG